MKTSDFLSDGGEMGSIIRSHDWSSTSIGPIDSWPQSLLTTLSIILNSNFPMFLFWGDDCICFYNDAYRPSLGNDGKHPFAIGKSAEEVWPEIWNKIKPQIDEVMAGGKATWSEDQLLPIYRNGKLEDVYWTYSYSPVKIETGKVGGVFVACTETTDKVKNLQKLKDSENLLRFAVEATELGTWDYNPKTNTFFGNERLKDWFGLPPFAEIELTSAIDVMIDSDKERVTKAIKDALEYESGGNYDIEYTIVNPETKIKRVVRAKGKAWFDEAKTPYRFNGTLQDVTEQYRSRVELENSKNRLHLLIDESPVRIIFLTGKEMRIELANDVVLKNWNKDKSIIGKPLKEVIPELESQVFLQVLEEVYTTGNPVTMKGTPVKYNINGALTQYYYDLWYKPMLNNEGQVYGVLSTAVDVTEKIVAQQRIEQSQRKMRSVVESAPFPIGVYVGPEMRIQLVNQSIMDIWGKGNDIAGKLYSEVLPELENQKVFEQLKSVYDTGIAFHAKNTKINLIVNGKRKAYYFNYSFTPLFDAEGKVYGVMNTAADVTELNIAKHKLEKSEQNLRNVILQAPVAMCIFKGADFTVEIANDMMLDFWGTSSDKVLGKPIFEGLPEVKDQGFEDLLNKVYTTGETHRALEVPVTVPRDGSLETLYIDFVYEAFRDDHGNITGVMALVIDATEQVLNRKEIEEAQEKARLAIESADLGPYEVDMNTNEINTSVRFNEIWGIKGEVTRQKLIDFIHPDDLHIREMAHADSLKTGNLHYETRIIKPDNSVHWVKIKGKIIHDENNLPVTLLGVIQDITEQKRFAEELTRQVHERTIQLQRSNDDLLQFAHVASHDLKEPIRKIKIFTNMIESDYAEILPERGMTYLAKVQNATDRMFSMVEGVLAYSTINSAERPIENVNLNTAIDHIETDLEIIMSQKNAIIIREKLPKLQGASVLLYQLFYNLINNSLKFAKADVASVITISSSMIKKDKTDFIKIIVADNGIGIDPDYCHRIFDAFTRLNTKDKYEGTGLGLALCKKIVERHHGTIIAEGEIGKGATFMIELPVKQTQQIL
ncbi:PAS domain S-box-containing protein [Flavobacterium arsenatis]|uniref:histidine kinase n=1 Tax=Flavobacterium arsenatis TaxID=1484332 RepID=A0ABU1TPW1_9FLAO|nr:PAS domain-containing protein [Flavobacterium arsenatis]MDR6967986.1 PAS domain S-box-containing protein [Flavobacterium arsenatis]